MFRALCLCIFILSSPEAPVEDQAEAPAETVVQSEGIRPKSNPWSNGYTGEGTGSCGELADGYGWTNSLFWPVDSHDVEPGRGFRAGHGAIDIVSPLGSSVYAAESGVVIWGGWSVWGGGNMVVLAHGGTYQTHYAHLATVDVSCGQFINKGQAIGTVGQTGSSSFPHVHFVVRYNGLNYNPLNWLN